MKCCLTPTRYIKDTEKNYNIKTRSIHFTHFLFTTGENINSHFGKQLGIFIQVQRHISDYLASISVLKRKH